MRRPGAGINRRGSGLRGIGGGRGPTGEVWQFWGPATSGNQTIRATGAHSTGGGFEGNATAWWAGVVFRPTLAGANTVLLQAGTDASDTSGFRVYANGSGNIIVSCYDGAAEVAVTLTGGWNDNLNKVCALLLEYDGANLTATLNDGTPAVSAAVTYVVSASASLFWRMMQGRTGTLAMQQGQLHAFVGGESGTGLTAGQVSQFWLDAKSQNIGLYGEGSGPTADIKYIASSTADQIDGGASDVLVVSAPLGPNAVTVAAGDFAW